MNSASPARRDVLASRCPMSTMSIRKSIATTTLQLLLNTSTNTYKRVRGIGSTSEHESQDLEMECCRDVEMGYTRR